MFLKGIVLLSVTILIVVIVLHEKNNCLIVANITKIFLNLAVAYRNLFQEKTTQSSFLHKEDLPMAETKKLYTLADILGEPITEQEAQNLIRKETNSDEQTFQNYVNLNETYRNKLLHFIMGKNGLSITYDTVFRHVMLPGGDTKRLEHFLSIIFDQPIHIKQILPREGSQIVENGNFVIADIIASMEDGSIINVEIQKIGYAFPGERSSCYTADMIMRQYNYLKNQNKKSFSYQDMRSVYLIVFMEHSPAQFHHTNEYIHRKISCFDTDVQINLLDNITFISLDTFRSVVQNIDTEQKAWLSFLTADDPDEIVRLVNAYPEFLPCYRDIISFRRRPKDLITTFSDALREMDRNTEIYMVEQLAKEVQEKDHALAEKDNVIAEKDNALAEQARLIEQLKKQLAETRSTD